MKQIPDQFKLKNTIKYPTSIIVGGVSALGFELADVLIEQGGYVILIDTFTPQNLEKLKVFPKDTLVSFLDYSSVPHLSEDIRRLDYVFYFNHGSKDLLSQITTHEFLQASNTLDSVLSLAHAFNAKFLLTTSIKAQQLLLSIEDLHFKLKSSFNSAYSEMELQRYSENLTQEYHDKKGLDTRIVRLGEMIGEHTDFSVRTAFTELIISAAHEMPLKLYKDGLEAEWYVHTLDASYGIIKAQFSKDTSGQIFSVSYDNPITHLSIAYKIQEYVDYPAEIIFVDEKDNLPHLAPYKPAPNLQVIGWKPKISFDKAVHQSLLAAKVFVAGHEVKREGHGIVSKLQKVISGNSDVEPDSALSRLIAERQRQEELKKRRLELAHSITKKKRSSKPRTLKEKLQNQFWKQYRSMAEIFTLLKKLSPAEVFGLLIVLTIFFISYIWVIAPTILLTKEAFSLSKNYEELKIALNQNNFEAVYEETDEINQNLQKMEEAMNFIKPYAKLIALDSYLDSYLETVKVYQEYSKALNEVAYFMEPLQNYLEDYEDNTQQRLSSDIYISLLNEGVNYEDEILEFESRIPFVESGAQKLQNIITRIPIPRKTLITALDQKLNDADLELVSYSNSILNLKNYQYLVDLLGINKPTTMAILIVDDSIPRSIGGEISSVAVVTMQNGSISYIDLKTPQDIELNQENLSDVLIEDVNKFRFAPIDKNQFTFEELATIGDLDNFSFHTKALLSDIYNVDIDGVVVIPLEDFTALHNKIFDKEEDLINKFRASNLQTKNQLVTQEFALTLHEFSKNFNNNFFKAVEFFSDNSNNGNVYAQFENKNIAKFISIKNFDNSQRKEVLQFFEIFVNTNDSLRVAGESFENSEYSLKYIVSADGAATFDVSLSPNLNFASQDWIICVPNSSIASGVKLKLSTGQNLKSLNINGKQCRIINIVNNNPFEISWNLDFIGDEVDGNIKYNFLLPSIFGQNVKVDAEFIFDEAYRSVLISPELIKSRNSFIFTNELPRDKVYDIELAKN
ncbi:MAG: hypothetical protein KatS3mg086_199 [Candidatus Dojkabacteria bacterium]|nr:MAG: hypothetical protein KatS3mg086_199 [Candidatus Dojkabacteria bacterium]